MDTQIPLKGMASLRILSGSVELIAALLMWRIGRVESALQINAALGLFGPTIMLLVTLIGIAGLAGQMPVTRLILIGAGAFLIFLGARS